MSGEDKAGEGYWSDLQLNRKDQVRPHPDGSYVEQVAIRNKLQRERDVQYVHLRHVRDALARCWYENDVNAFRVCRDLKVEYMTLIAQPTPMGMESPPLKGRIDLNTGKPIGGMHLCDVVCEFVVCAVVK